MQVNFRMRKLFNGFGHGLSIVLSKQEKKFMSIFVSTSSRAYLWFEKKGNSQPTLHTVYHEIFKYDGSTIILFTLVDIL